MCNREHGSSLRRQPSTRASVTTGKEGIQRSSELTRNDGKTDQEKESDVTFSGKVSRAKKPLLFKIFCLLNRKVVQ